MKIFDDVINKLSSTTESTVRDLADIGIKAAQETNLFKTSSTFKEHVIFVPLDETSGFITFDADYGHWLEEGNNQKGSYIYPVNGKALKFQVNGQTIFAKKVKTHGPLPFMSNAREKVEQSIEEIFNRNFSKLQ